MFETTDINLIPKGDLPVIHVSQYDIGRIIKFKVTNDGDNIDFFGTLKDIKITIRKVDSNLIIYEASTTIENNTVVLVTTEQMTACAGNNIGEITFTFNNPVATGSSDDVLISTCNFILAVKPSPECGGLVSSSDIANLDNQIASIVDEQLDNYYTKSEIDSQIETIVTEQVTPIVAGIVEEQVPPAVQAELSNYYDKDDIDTYFYNKSETDTLLEGKANTSDLPDMTDYYTKSDTDTLLSGKVSTSTLNDYYTKTETDELVSADMAILEDLPANTTKTYTIPTKMQNNNGVYLLAAGNNYGVGGVYILMSAGSAGGDKIKITALVSSTYLTFAVISATQFSITSSAAIFKLRLTRIA